MYVFAGCSAIAHPCAGVHRSTSLMSLSLLLQQCSLCLVRLILIVFVMGGRCLYSCYFVGCCLQDLWCHKTQANQIIWQCLSNLLPWWYLFICLTKNVTAYIYDLGVVIGKDVITKYWVGFFFGKSHKHMSSLAFWTINYYLHCLLIMITLFAIRCSFVSYPTPIWWEDSFSGEYSQHILKCTGGAFESVNF